MKNFSPLSKYINMRSIGALLNSLLKIGFCVMLVFVQALPANAADTKDNHKTDVLRATLDNGLKVVIVRNPLSPVVTTEINYLVGSNEAPKGFPGMAHALEHMMFRGSPGLTAAQLADISAAMGGEFDADTQQIVTQYFFTVPVEDLDVALHIEAIRMRSLLATEELWTKERGAIEQEVAQDLSNPQYVFYTKLLAAMFKGTPYAHDALGTRPSFQKTTGAMLRKFHSTWYAPNNAILVIVGDVQPAQTLTKVEELFKDIPAKKIPDKPAIKLQPMARETLNIKTDLPYGLTVLSFRMPGYDDKDYAAAQILADVLDSQRADLYALVPQGKALYAGFNMDSLPQAGIGSAMAAFPSGTDPKALMQDIKTILLDTVKKGVSADLVEATKRMEVAQAEFQKNSVSGLAEAWSQAVAVEGRQSPEDDINAIKKVTVADVNRVARQYIKLDHAIISVLTPQSSGKPISTKSFGGKESFAPTETKHVKLPAWAEKAVKKLAVPKSTLHPDDMTLPNGLRLIVQPVAISDTVSVYGHIKNRPELETPKGQEGVDQVLDQLFSFGTTSLDRLAYQKALDDIGAQASAGTDFYLQVLTDQFGKGIQLLADNELHPALPKKAFKVTQNQVAGTVAGQLESPDYLVSEALRKALFPKDDPSLRQATPKSVSSLTLDDVKAYYEHVFRPDMTTIVIIGNTTPEKAKEVVTKFFGSWKAEGPKPQTLLPPVPANKPSIVNVPDVSRVQDKVILAQTLGITRSNPDYYALELGNHVLGGAFYATRLYKDLREKNGLVYYVSSNFQVSKTRGIYMVDFACDPPNVSKVRYIVAQELMIMGTKLVSPNELNMAKAILLREIPLSESSVSNIAHGLLSRVKDDLPLDEPVLAAHRYLDLDAEHVKSAYEKWIRPKDLVQVSEGPTPK